MSVRPFPRTIKFGNDRYIALAYASDCRLYHHRFLVVKDNSFGQDVARLFRFIYRYDERLARYEAKRLGLKEGEKFPMLSLVGLMMLPYWILNRFGTQISATYHDIITIQDEINAMQTAQLQFIKRSQSEPWSPKFVQSN